MVTKLFIRIPLKEKAAAAAGDSKTGTDKLQKAGSSGDNNKIDATEVDVQLQRRQATDGAENYDIDDGGKSETVAKCQKNDNASKKRSPPLGDAGDNGKKRLRQRGQKFIDLSDVPEQIPILNNSKDDSSKHKGVYFDEVHQKWKANIQTDGKQYSIGYYDNEEEASRAYAHELFKHREGRSAVERQLLQKRPNVIDLSDVPEQLPILKRGSSKYKGVSFDKARKKWHALISIHGKSQTIGFYDNEEEAAKDYARAVYKYRAGKSAVKRLQQKRQKAFDLSDVPEQLPILKSNGKSGSSKYQGVAFDEVHQKWKANIQTDWKQYSIGYYDNEEEASRAYARELFKHREGKSVVQRKKVKLMIDLRDVPEQLPILKGGSSKYLGVTFSKAYKKWHAQISIDGKSQTIGFYDNEEEAAKDYARAVHKYRGGKSHVEGQQERIGAVTNRGII